MRVSQPRIEMTMIRPPVSRQCRLKNKNAIRNREIDMVLLNSLSDRMRLRLFWNFFVDRMAGMNIAAMRMASPIRRSDGEMNIGKGVRFKAYCRPIAILLYSELFGKFYGIIV